MGIRDWANTLFDFIYFYFSIFNENKKNENEEIINDKEKQNKKIQL